jgi:hypothetical protein
VKKLALLLTMAFSSAVNAQTPSTTAGAVALNCARVVPGMKIDNGASAMCVVQLSAFLNGWRAGADRGARTGLINDKAAEATVQGISDLQTRVAKLRPIARCMSDQVNYFDLARDLVAYVQRNPELASKPYSVVLTDMIQDSYCP